MTDNTALSASVTVETLPVVAFQNVRVLTTDLLAQRDGTDPKNIRMNHANNADRFEHGKHFFKLEGEARREFKKNTNRKPDHVGSVESDRANDIGAAEIAPNVNALTLWTERGGDRHAKILDTDAAWEVFEKLENAYFNPREASSPSFTREPPTPSRRAVTPNAHVAALKLSRTAMTAARAFGLKGNQAALSADHAIRAMTGVSPLVLMGQTHLAADPRGQTDTPTDLGNMLVKPLSAVKTNRLLEAKGMQVHDIKGDWTPTDKAQEHGEWLDTNKRHGDGTPIKQLKWFASVLR
ncbi:ORF6N domain-containing protein [uncultured Thiocystis sp.]|jgi:hypothetical protein|uniref:ORF6N domain-containing protein n=1 Tax=uncultured Thiocystis sp. TaxID=1202134 RepID=UPI0025DAB9EE|nr:ORF6N domain-containing protein [uncultured Thiocystis sp.]